MEHSLSRRGLFTVTAGGLAFLSLIPPAEVLAQIAGAGSPTEPRRYFPLDRSMLRAGAYDLYVQPDREAFLAKWYDGDALITEARIAVATMIADEPYHALAPLQGLTQDFVGPQAKLQRAFFQYPGGARPLMAEERLIQRLKALEGGLPVATFNPGFDTNPPLFTNRPIWAVDKSGVRA